MNNRTTRATWTFLSQVTFTAITLVVSLVSVPPLLKWLGEERFGAWRAISDWFGYLSLLEFGLSASLLALFARSLAGKASDKTEEVIATGFRRYLKTVSLIVPVGIVLGLSMPWLLRIQHLQRAEIWLSCVFALAVSLTLPFSIGRLLYSAAQKEYLVNGFLVGQSILITALLLLMAYLGWGIPGQAFATFLGQIPLAVFLGVVLHRRTPRFWRRAEDPLISNSLRLLNWPTFAHNLSGRVGLLSDNIVIALVLTPAAVAPFYLTQRLITIALAQIQNIGNSSWAGLIELHHRGETNIFTQRVLELTTVVSGLGFVFLAPIGAFNRHFIERWLGSASYAGDWVTALACINAWVLAAFNLWSWLIVSGGQVRRWAPYAVAFTVTNLLASLGATFFFGLAGPLIGTTLSLVLVQSWAMPRVLQAIFGFASLDLWRAFFQPALWGVPFAAVCVTLARCQRTPLGWIALLAQMSSAALAGVLLWWQFSLDAEARRQWLFRLSLLTSPLRSH